MLKVNELETETHNCANYLEFLEAYSRVCEEASTVLHYGEDPDDHPDIPDEERTRMPLHEKIENTIQYLLHNCTPKSFMDKFETPKKHP